MAPEYDEYRPDFTYLVGGGYGGDGMGQRLYAVYRNGRLLILQSRTAFFPVATKENPCFPVDPDFFCELDIVQTLLDSMDFARANWAFIIHGNDGSHRLMYRHKRPDVTFPVWLPLVDEREIFVTKWNHPECREGIWNGQEVDIFMGWNTYWGRMALQESEGMKKIAELGLGHLIFKPLAHVVSHGHPQGLMKVPCRGRPLLYSDRAAVYHAVASLQSKGFVHGALRFDTIVVTDEGIKFSDIFSIRWYTKKETQKMEEEASECHWAALERLFTNIQNQIIDEGCFLLLRSFQTTAKLIPRLPSLTRPVTPDSQIFLAAFAHMLRLAKTDLEARTNVRDLEPRTSAHTVDFYQRYGPGPKKQKAAALMLKGAEEDEGEDKPLVIADHSRREAFLRHRSTHIRLHHVLHPYSHRHSRAIALAPDDSLSSE